MSDALAAALGIVGLITAVGGWLKVIRPRWRRARAQFIAAKDSIIGRPAELDSITGREIAPALPGVGMRLASIEDHNGRLTEAVASLAKSHERLDDHETRISALEVASVERIVTRVESAAGWRAVEEAIRADPDTEGATE